MYQQKHSIPADIHKKETMSLIAKHLKLHTGALMPIIGMGTYLSSNTQTAVDAALHAGYRHIDTALSYGTEGCIAEVVNDRIRAGKLKRKELFLTTKVPPAFLDKNWIKLSAEKSLENLQTPYVDMLLIHSPLGLKNLGDWTLRPVDEKGNVLFENYDLQESWFAMEELVGLGKARHIGVSNFSLSRMQKLWNLSRVKPSNLQSECHLYLQQEALRGFCQKRGVVVSGYSSLGAPGRPSRHTLEEDPVLLDDPTLLKLAKKYLMTPPQVALRFLIQKQVCVLPKSDSPERIKENFEVLDDRFQISEDDMKLLEERNKDFKYLRFFDMMKHPDYPHNESF